MKPQKSKSKNIKVFILTEGGKNIGFGHITRNISLSQAFKKFGVTTEFIVNGDNTIKSFLKNEKHRIFNWVKKKNDLLKLIKNANLVIIDSYMAGPDFYKDTSDIAKKCVYIDDNRRLDFPSGTIVNGMIYAEGLRYRKKEGRFCLLGTRYSLMRKEFWALSPKKLNIHVGTVLVTFGGDDKRNMTFKILKYLKKSHPSLIKNVVIGNAFRNKKSVEGLKDTRTRLIYNPNGCRMKKIMKKSDFAISAGGQSLHELAGVGVPTIGICIAKNQEKNLQAWHKIGFLEYIGWYVEKNLLSKLEKAILAITPYEERRKRSRIGSRLIDGKGALRVAAALLKGKK